MICFFLILIAQTVTSLVGMTDTQSIVLPQRYNLLLRDLIKITAQRNPTIKRSSFEKIKTFPSLKKVWSHECKIAQALSNARQELNKAACKTEALIGKNIDLVEYISIARTIQNVKKIVDTSTQAQVSIEKIMIQESSYEPPCGTHGFIEDSEYRLITIDSSSDLLKLASPDKYQVGLEKCIASIDELINTVMHVEIDVQRVDKFLYACDAEEVAHTLETVIHEEDEVASILDEFVIAQEDEDEEEAIVESSLEEAVEDVSSDEYVSVGELL